MKTFRVAMACALGALIGTLAALQFTIYFSWIGFIVGGIVGYMTYDFREVVQAVPRSYHWAIQEFFPGLRLIAKELCENAKTTLPIALFLVNSLVIMIGAFGVPFALEKYLGSGFIAWVPFILYGVVSFVFGIVAFIFFIMTMGVFCDLCFGRPLKKDTSLEMARDMRNPKVFLYCNPVTVLIGAPFAVIAGIGFVLYIIEYKKIVFATAAFFKYLFIQIHSEVRLLCFVDAALGSVIGYSYDHFFIGMIAGAALGVINYEIVSKRLLKLVPQNN